MTEFIDINESIHDEYFQQLRNSIIDNMPKIAMYDLPTNSIINYHRQNKNSRNQNGYNDI